VPSAVSDVGDTIDEILSEASFLLLSPCSPAGRDWLGSLERETVGTKDGEPVSRIQKPQDAAQYSFTRSEEEQYCVIISQYGMESAHVGSKVGTSVGYDEGCLEGLPEGVIDGEAVGLTVLLLQVPQETGQSL